MKAATSYEGRKEKVRKELEKYISVVRLIQERGLRRSDKGGEVNMLTVTESAKRQLRETLLAHSNDPEFGLRLLVKAPGEFGLKLDKETRNDHVVELEGLKVLLVGREISDLVDGVTLDTKDTPDGAKLVISKKQPNS